jgi:hypothetical protein
MELVLYHGNCPDGFGAAWASWLALGDDARYVPVNHGSAPPDVGGADRVYVLDISYPPDVLTTWAAGRQVVVLDHHKTADLAAVTDHPQLQIVYDLEKSGATLAWDWFHGANTREVYPGVPRRFVEYLEDRDLWRWQLPQSREVSVALWSHPRNFRGWTTLAQNLEGLMSEGVAILRYQRLLVEQMAAQARWQELDGHRIPVVNATTCVSEVAEWLCEQHPEAPFAAYYLDRGDGQRQWGLRARRGGCDVSALAKRRGGGGHAAAAGWVESLPSDGNVR